KRQREITRSREADPPDDAVERHGRHRIAQVSEARLPKRSREQKNRQRKGANCDGIFQGPLNGTASPCSGLAPAVAIRNRQSTADDRTRRGSAACVSPPSS